MRLLPDDPIVASALRTGYAPWQLPRRERYEGDRYFYPHEPDYDDDDDFDEEGDDVFYGNETDDF